MALNPAFDCAVAFRPAQQSSRDEPIDGLETTAPQASRPKRLRKNRALPLREQLGRIMPLVFQQMAQVFARQHAKYPAALREAAGDLEIDDTRTVARHTDPVGFFGEVVMGDAVRVHPAQLSQRITKIAARIETRAVERIPGQIAAHDTPGRFRNESRARNAAGELAQRARFTPCEPTSEAARPGRCVGRFANHAAAVRVVANRAERIAFELDCGRSGGFHAGCVMRFHASDLRGD